MGLETRRCIHAVALIFVTFEIMQKKFVQNSICKCFWKQVGKNKKREIHLSHFPLPFQPVGPVSREHPLSPSLSLATDKRGPLVISHLLQPLRPSLTHAATTWAASRSYDFPHVPRLGRIWGVLEPKPPFFPPFRAPLPLLPLAARSKPSPERKSRDPPCANGPNRAVLTVFVALVSSPTLPAFFSTEFPAFTCLLAPWPWAPTSSMAAGHGACRAGAPPATLRAWADSRRSPLSRSALGIENHAPWWSDESHRRASAGNHGCAVVSFFPSGSRRHPLPLSFYFLFLSFLLIMRVHLRSNGPECPISLRGPFC